MLCPYCNIGINVNWNKVCYPVPTKKDDYEEGYAILSGFCPVCNEFIITLQYSDEYYESPHEGQDEIGTVEEETLLYPKFPANRSISKYIPPKYTNLLQEAIQVNNISPRASATLSRYLLQMVLHEELNIYGKNLEQEIAGLENKNNIPSTLVAMLQVMRRVANFGAHPKKSTNSNEILEIEAGEADIMLGLLNELFDFVFVKPKQQKEFLEDVYKKYGISDELSYTDI